MHYINVLKIAFIIYTDKYNHICFKYPYDIDISSRKHTYIILTPLNPTFI